MLGSLHYSVTEDWEEVFKQHGTTFQRSPALLVAIPHRSCIRLMSAVTPFLPQFRPHLQSTVLTIDVVVSTSDAAIEFLHIDEPVSDVSLCQVGRLDFQG